jgi:hypothetical protein
MQRVDLKKPGEQKKLIAAVALGVVALIVLWWTFIGFGSSTQTTPRTTGARNTNGGTATTTSQQITANRTQPIEDLRADPLTLQPISFSPVAPPANEAKRNIFAYYEAPKPVQKEAQVPTPTPTPTPPVLLATISPANVYARTADFTLEITGDKFSPDLRVVVDGREMPTRYAGPQQLSAAVPASVIASAGSRQISLRSPDGKAYSNAVTLNVSQPPTPNYTYIGIIGTQRHVDTAMLQDRSNREVVNVQRGDVVGGRFRITSISDKELILVDTNLKIRHTLALTLEGDKTYNPLQRPTPKVDSEDDEP